MKTAAVVALVLLAGCASGFRRMRDTLPAEDSAAFDACYHHVAGRACPSGDGFQRSACMGQIADQYRPLPSAEDRRAYLIQAGCPAVLTATQRP